MNQEQSRGQVAYHSGAAAEQIAQRTYQANGYRIIAQRWRGASGEIDLIAQDETCLAFVEVKKARSFERAAERVSQLQMQRIYATAEEYLGTFSGAWPCEMRFDVALVDVHGACNIIENAFGLN